MVAQAPSAAKARAVIVAVTARAGSLGGYRTLESYLGGVTVASIDGQMLWFVASL